MERLGIKRLWQVRGRSNLDYPTRVYLDIWYVKTWSLWCDIAILFKTVALVFKQRGAYWLGGGGDSRCCHLGLPPLISQRHACSMMVSSEAWRGDQPKTPWAKPASATKRAGSPWRRGASWIAMARPVTRRAVSITSCTEKPWPLPRL